MDKSIGFWINKARWPEDAAGYSFLANVVQRVGQFLFPAEWNGFEPIAGKPPLTRGKNQDGNEFRLHFWSADISTERLMHNLLVKNRPEFGRIPLPNPGAEIPPFSVDERIAGLDELEKLAEIMRPPYERRVAVEKFIKTAIVDGRLRYVTLPERGGAFSAPREPSWWNVRDYQRLFYFCQIKPSDPFTIGVGGDGFEYIFLHQEDLNSLLSKSEKIDESIEAFNFWANPNSWPRSTSQYVFLASALDRVGEALFPGAWHLDKMAHVTTTPDFSNGIGLAQQVNGAGAMYLSSLVEASLRDHGLKLSASEAFRKFGAEEDKADRVLVGSAVDYFIELCVNERLVAFGQTIGGGAPFEPISSIEWTRDEAVNWFVFCHNGHEPASPMRLKHSLPVGERPLNIFIERASLDKVLRVIGEAHPFTPDPTASAWWQDDKQGALIEAATAGSASPDNEMKPVADAKEEETIQARIRTAGGIAKLTAASRDILKAITAIGGEERLPASVAARNRMINESLVELGSSSLSDKTIQRFFKDYGKS